MRVNVSVPEEFPKILADMVCDTAAERYPALWECEATRGAAVELLMENDQLMSGILKRAYKEAERHAAKYPLLAGGQHG